MSRVMRAVVHERYGAVDEVLRVREVPVPEVADDEVLVRVRAASVHPDIWHVVTGRPYVLRLMGSGVRRPKYRIPGTDLAGRVESVGRTVTRFRVGDEVFGESHPGFQWRNGGTFANSSRGGVPDGQRLIGSAVWKRGQIEGDEAIIYLTVGGIVGCILTAIALGVATRSASQPRVT